MKHHRIWRTKRRPRRAIVARVARATAHIFLASLLGGWIAAPQPCLAQSPTAVFWWTLATEYGTSIRQLNPGYWADKYWGAHGEEEMIAYRQSLENYYMAMMVEQSDATFGASQNPYVAVTLSTLAEPSYAAAYGKNLAGTCSSPDERLVAGSSAVLSVVSPLKARAALKTQQVRFSPPKTLAPPYTQPDPILVGMHPDIPGWQPSVINAGISPDIPGWQPSITSINSGGLIKPYSITVGAGLPAPTPFKPLPQIIPPRTLWQALAIEETISSIPNLQKPLPAGWEIFAGKGSQGSKGKAVPLRSADRLAELTGTCEGDWLGVSRDISPPVGYEGYRMQYHFWYNTQTKSWMPHYFKIQPPTVYYNNQILPPGDFRPF